MKDALEISCLFCFVQVLLKVMAMDKPRQRLHRPCLSGIKGCKVITTLGGDRLCGFRSIWEHSEEARKPSKWVDIHGNPQILIPLSLELKSYQQIVARHALTEVPEDADGQRLAAPGLRGLLQTECLHTALRTLTSGKSDVFPSSPLKNSSILWHLMVFHGLFGLRTPFSILFPPGARRRPLLGRAAAVALEYAGADGSPRNRAASVGEAAEIVDPEKIKETRQILSKCWCYLNELAMINVLLRDYCRFVDLRYIVDLI